LRRGHSAVDLLAARVAGGAREAAYWIGVSAVLLVTAAIVAHGVYHGSLPQDSLISAGDIGSLVAAFTSTRCSAWAGAISRRITWPFVCPRRPRRFAIRTTSSSARSRELGIVGGVLLMAWLARIAWELTRPNQPAATPAPRGTLILLVLAIALGILINMAASIDWSAAQRPSRRS
jgi:hypothetical protein